MNSGEIITLTFGSVILLFLLYYWYRNAVWISSRLKIPILGVALMTFMTGGIGFFILLGLASNAVYLKNSKSR
jgi:hypothetical protein